MPRAKHTWRPSDDQMSLWPTISGNTINGVGESKFRRPSPVYWQPPDTIPHGHLQAWFGARTLNNHEHVVAVRRELAAANERVPAPIATERVEKSAAQWTSEIKKIALESGADIVGITSFRPEWVFEGQPVPSEHWIIVVGVAQDYDAMVSSPSVYSMAETLKQYARGANVTKDIADWIRGQGHPATAKCGPGAGTFVMIPAAVECGLGELGKHGSLIHRELGASFRLACVLTDVPLIADHRDEFGVDDFCERCRVCEDACPPGALFPDKQLIRGEERWYVDFDKCLPFFNENLGCAICLVVCPWSRPGVAPIMVEKYERRVQNELREKSSEYPVVG